jgi:hypothetical protein
VPAAIAQRRRQRAPHDDRQAARSIASGQCCQAFATAAASHHTGPCGQAREIVSLSDEHLQTLLGREPRSSALRRAGSATGGRVIDVERVTSNHFDLHGRFAR